MKPGKHLTFIHAISLIAFPLAQKVPGIISSTNEIRTMTQISYNITWIPWRLVIQSDLQVLRSSWLSLIGAYQLAHISQLCFYSQYKEWEFNISRIMLYACFLTLFIFRAFHHHAAPPMDICESLLPYSCNVISPLWSQNCVENLNTHKRVIWWCLKWV